jgi:hypothetical protein
MDFTKLKQKPRSSMKVDGRVIHNIMAANDDCLLYYSIYAGLTLLDAKGKEQFTVHRAFSESDICWSSYLNLFLLVSEKVLYSLDASTQKILKVNDFITMMNSCTCSENTLMVTTANTGSSIEVFDMKANFKLIRTFEPPLSCQTDQRISSIRLNTNRSHLGATLTESEQQWFELRDSKDMTVLQKVDSLTAHHLTYNLQVLPNDEFFVYSCYTKDSYRINNNGRLKEIIRPSVAEKAITFTNFIPNDKCLVLQMARPRQLVFYDL